MTTTTCKDCGASIIWVTTKGGRHVPVDEEAIFGFQLIEGQEPQRGYGARLRVSHYTTCPENKP